MARPKYDKNIELQFNEALDADDINTVRKLYKSNKVSLGYAFTEVSYSKNYTRKTDLMLELLEYFEENPPNFPADKSLLLRSPDDSYRKEGEFTNTGILVDMWQTYLGAKYGIHMHINDYAMEDYEVLHERASESLMILKGINKLALTVQDVLTEYKNHNINYKQARDKLGELLTKSLNITNGRAAFDYTVKCGAPITYKEGKVFSNAIEKFGSTIFNFRMMSEERLNYFLSNKTRATNAITAVIKYLGRNKADDESINNSLYFLFFDQYGEQLDISQRVNEYKNHIYDILFTYYNDNPVVTAYIEDNIK